MSEKETKKHMCEGALPEDSYGAAINMCDADNENKLWASNGEYASQVNYCPYCGLKAEKQVDCD